MTKPKRPRRAYSSLFTDTASTDLRHDLGHASVVIRPARGRDDEVGSMTLIERPTILSPALALGQLTAADRLPGVGPGIAESLLSHRPLIPGEQVRKADRDDRPFAVFLIPGRALPQQGMNLGIAIRRKMEATMA